MYRTVLLINFVMQELHLLALSFISKKDNIFPHKKTNGISTLEQNLTHLKTIAACFIPFFLLQNLEKGSEFNLNSICGPYS